MRIADLTSTSLDPEWGITDPTIGLGGATVVMPDSGGGDSIVILFELPVGKRTGRHTDSAEEVIYVISGQVEAHVGDEVGTVAAGSMVVVHPMVPHDIRNAGEVPARCIGFFSGRTVDSVFEQALLPRGTDTFSLP